MWGVNIMTITVYNYKAEKNRLDKTPFLTTAATVGSYPGKARDAVDVVTPSVAVAANVTTGNYAYIDTTGFYYWIESKNIVRDNYTVLSLRRDPLTSFATSIKKSPCVCERSTKKYNSKVNDPLYPVEQRKQVWAKELFAFPNTDIQVFGYIE